MPDALAQQAAHLITARAADFSVPPGDVILVGIGSGGLALSLSQLWPTARIVGIDSSSDKVREANRAAVEGGVSARVRFQQANLRSLPFPDGSVDVVVATGYFGVVSYPAGALSEIRRVLRSGGLGYAVEGLAREAKAYARTIPFKTPEGLSSELDLRALCDGLAKGATATLEVHDGELPVALIVVRREVEAERPPY